MVQLSNRRKNAVSSWRASKRGGPEDFADMLQPWLSNNIWIGNGAGGCFLHNRGYDVGDEILPVARAAGLAW